MRGELIAKITCSMSRDDGATGVEYAILAASIAAVIVAIVGLLGLEVLELFTSLAAALGV